MESVLVKIITAGLILGILVIAFLAGYKIGIYIFNKQSIQESYCYIDNGKEICRI